MRLSYQGEWKNNVKNGFGIENLISKESIMVNLKMIKGTDMV